MTLVYSVATSFLHKLFKIERQIESPMRELHGDVAFSQTCYVSGHVSSVHGSRTKTIDQ